MGLLDNFYIQGHGIPQDFVRVRELLEHAMNLGNDKACCFLVQMHLNGYG